MLILRAFLVLIFIRPFISSPAFPDLDMAYSLILFISALAWLCLKGFPWKEIEPLKYPLLAVALTMIASLLFSSDRANSLKELYKYAGAFLIFFTCARLSSREKESLIKVMVFSAMVITALTIYQYTFGFKNLTDYLHKQGNPDPLLLMYIEQKRAFFPFVTPGSLAEYLILIFPLLLTIKDKDRWFTIILFAVAVFLTKSMGAMLSIFLGMGFYLYLRKEISYTKLAFLGGLIIISVVIFSLRQTSQIAEFLPFSSLFNRITYWMDTCAVIKMYPFTGIGLGNFNLPLTRYAHNAYLQLWAELGIFGLIAFIWLITGVFRIGGKKIADSPCKKEAVCLMTASFTFLFANLTGFTFFLPEVSLLWWAILGLTISL